MAHKTACVQTVYNVWTCKHGSKTLASSHDTAEAAECEVQFLTLHFPDSIHFWNSDDTVIFKEGEK